MLTRASSNHTTMKIFIAVTTPPIQRPRIFAMSSRTSPPTMMMAVRTISRYHALSVLFAAITTIILVRHAEKAGPSGDVPLNAAGVARANELARVLGTADIAAIYTTPFVRVRQTAQPLANALHLTPIEVKTGDTYARDVVKR